MKNQVGLSCTVHCCDFVLNKYAYEYLISNHHMKKKPLLLFCLSALKSDIYDIQVY